MMFNERFLMQTPEEIYKTYNKKIFNFAYRMIGNKDDAADITQETFIQALNSLEKFRGESCIYTWLFQIAKNKCIRFLEKQKRTSFINIQELIDNVSSPVSDGISESDKQHYIAQVKEGCLCGLLRCLSLHQRLAFILNILFDLPVEDVAVILGKSENASRILVHRSRQNIKEFMCRNCSLINPGNKCKCKNLINFSLKKGWIGKDNNSVNLISRIETEIDELKRIAGLYKSLQNVTPPEKLASDFNKQISARQNFLILSNKKVK